jgi:hypothetical protein
MAEPIAGAAAGAQVALRDDVAVQVIRAGD